jgi:hypothetical protein
MANQNNEQQPGKPAPVPPEKPAEKKVLATLPETSAPSSPTQSTETTDTMEVHHHAHAGHGKKTWKSYFWEFLMLFLAVFCGFLAEYQLEHVVEHNREKQYIESMLDDLKKDSVRIAFFIDRNKTQVTGFDSLLQNIYHTPYTDSSVRTLYYLKEKYTLVASRAIFSKATISQLKNSGGFRLIRNRAATDSIIAYDIATDRVEGQGEAIDFSGRKLLDLSVKIFDGEYTLDNSVININDILNSDNKFNLLNTNEKLIREYANLAKFKRDVIKNYIRQLTQLEGRVPGMIRFLQEEYHLK